MGWMLKGWNGGTEELGPSQADKDALVERALDGIDRTQAAKARQVLADGDKDEEES